MNETSQLLAHFYRASVMRADVWRQRLDATTNWAVVTTVAVIAFAFGDRAAPHVVLLMVLVFDLFFLLMESRRYQVYDLWERRVRALHHYLIAPALIAPDPESLERELTEAREGLRELAADLASTVPRLSLPSAAAYRVRRNYGLLVTLALFAWVLKLSLHPEAAAGIGEVIARASVGPVAGWYVVVAVAAFAALIGAAAILAPSEEIVGWSDVHPTIRRRRPARS